MKFNKTVLSWFVVGLILPLLVFVFFVSPFNEKIAFSTGIENNETYFFISSPDPSPREMIRQIFNAPFDLNWYDACFIDGGTRLVGLRGNTTLSVEIKKLTPEKESRVLYISSTAENCTPIKTGQRFTYSWSFDSEISIPVNELNKNNFVVGRLEPRVSSNTQKDTYAKPEFWSYATRFALFWIAWFGLSLLFLELKKQLLS